MNVTKKTTLANSLVLASLLSLPCALYAFDLPKIPGLGSKSDSAAATTTDNVDAMAMNDDLVKKYVAAQLELNASQTFLSQALGLSDQIALLNAEKTALSSGNVMDESGLKKDAEVSGNNIKLINEQMTQGHKLTDEERAAFIQSLPHLISAVSLTKQLPSSFERFIDSSKRQIISANLTEKMSVTNKLKSGMYVVSNTPSLVGNLLSTMKNVMAYAKSNDIEVPKNAESVI